ncbi:MAG: transporter permease [Actinomycetia bacterium]|nr:transporter permease [Actinomycetes bacterium]
MAWRRGGRAVTDAEPSLSVWPAESKGLFPEAEIEAIADAVIEDRGGAAAIESLREADTGVLPKKRFGPVFWISVTWVLGIIALAVFASWLPLPDPKATGVAKPRLGFSIHHLLGTDELGRDQLSRVIYGARVSMTVGFASIFFGIVVGGFLGVVAGFYRGKLETLIMGAMDVLLAFPALVLALAIITFLGQNLRNVVFAISILAIAPIARLIRSATLTVSQREFVMAARSLGAKNFRIIAREILPVVMLPVFSFALIGVAVAVVAEGALAFLGLSVPAPTPTWGGMITDGRVYLQQDPWIAFIPAIVLFITVLALNFAGDTLRTRFDVREGAL